MFGNETQAIGEGGPRPTIGAGAFVASNDQYNDNDIQKQKPLGGKDIWTYAANHPKWA